MNWSRLKRNIPRGDVGLAILSSSGVYTLYGIAYALSIYVDNKTTCYIGDIFL